MRSVTTGHMSHAVDLIGLVRGQIGDLLIGLGLGDRARVWTAKPWDEAASAIV